MIPPFSPDGLLPYGTHDCTLDEIRTTLGFTPRRVEMFKNLHRLLEMLPGHSAIDYLLVDGSYAESKPDPGDVDVGIVVSDLVHGGESAQVAQWVNTRYETLYRLWRLDIVVLDQAMVDEYWLHHFTHTRSDRAKGVLRMRMGGTSNP